jgi:hypothetical protein
MQFSTVQPISHTPISNERFNSLVQLSMMQRILLKLHSTVQRIFRMLCSSTEEVK